MKHFDTFVLILLSTLCFINIHVMGQDNTGSTNQTALSKLQFVVPKRDELSDFVKVTQLSNGTYIFSGFSIEVFRAAAKFAIPSRSWDFIPFEKSDGTMNGTFDDMLREVEKEAYDGAVGEITILKKRMEYVYFTMPYLDTKIGMLVRVPTRSDESVAILAPATKVILVLVGLLGSGILVAVVFWIWELCKYSHGSSSTQPSGTTLGSIMHVRLVIILALMVLLLTIASYVPRQSSSLPTELLVSDIKSLADVRRRGLKVGYRQGAFVKNMLVEKEGFLESQLVEVESEVVLLHKLQIGTKDGGIDALVAGVHHLKLFQSKYCENFTLVPDFNLKSTGLGFEFPHNQDPPLVKAFSEAIVRLIDNGEMAEIQARTIGDLDNICEGNNETIAAGSTYQDGISFWLPVTSAIFVVVLVIAVLLAYCGTLMTK